MRNILAIGAHPDDIELGCGGAMIKYAKAGHNVYLCVMCDGNAGGDPSVRRREQEHAAKLMGAKELIWGNLKDTEFSIDQKTINFIEGLVKRIQPDEVYVNYGEDTHQDHRALTQCVISATRYIKRVLFYEDYTSVNFQPDIFVDIEDVLDDKIAVIKAFQSQMTKRHPFGLNMIEGTRAVANFRGFQGKIKFAEGYKAVRYLKLDIV